MPEPITPERADEIARLHFATYHESVRAKVSLSCIVVIPEHAKVFYDLTWALPQPWTIDDGSLLGHGGFFVSLITGEIDEVGSGVRVAAEGFVRDRDRLAQGAVSSPKAVAEALATHDREYLLANPRWRFG